MLSSVALTMVDDLPKVTIYVDGAAEPNPGPGGYGVVLLFGEHRKELSCGYTLTTNNRMELLAVIAGLEALTKPCEVMVYSDSRYVVDAVEKGSVVRWKAAGWWRSKTHKVKNVDFWERFLAAAEMHSIALSWVPGHQGVEENERCDRLAGEASRSENLLADTGYEPPDRSSSAETEAANKAKITHTEPGEPCRACGTPLVRRTPKQKKRKLGQSYYYEWYLHCTGCQAIYMVESAKRQYPDTGSLFGET